MIQQMLIEHTFYKSILPKDDRPIFYYTQDKYISYGFIYYCLSLIVNNNAKLVRDGKAERQIISRFGREIRDKLVFHWIDANDVEKYRKENTWLVYFSSGHYTHTRSIELKNVNYGATLIEKENYESLQKILNLPKVDEQYTVILEQNTAMLTEFASAVLLHCVWKVIKLLYNTTVYWLALNHESAQLLSSTQYNKQNSELGTINFSLNRLINSEFSSALQIAAGDSAMHQLVLLQALQQRKQVSNWGNMIYYGALEDYAKLRHCIIMTDQQSAKLNSYLSLKFINDKEINSLTALQNMLLAYLPPLKANSIVVIGNFTRIIESEYARSVSAKPTEELADELYREQYEEIMEMFSDEKRHKYIASELIDADLGENTKNRFIHQLNRKFDAKLQMRLQHAYESAQRQAREYQKFATQKAYNKFEGKYTPKARKRIVKALQMLELAARRNRYWIFLLLPMKQYTTAETSERIAQRLPNIQQFYQNPVQKRFEYLTDKLILKLLHAKEGVFPNADMSLHYYSSNNNSITAYHKKAKDQQWTVGWWSTTKVSNFVAAELEAMP